MNYLIYKLNKELLPPAEKCDGDLKVWKPKGLAWRHSRLPAKYILFSFFHFFGLFQNRHFQVWFLSFGPQIATFFSIVPKCYRWPFMKPNDVQFAYLITEKPFRGKGLAYKAMLSAIHELAVSGDYWWVTDTDNIASQKLAAKLGFELVGEGKQESKFFGFVKFLKIKGDGR